MTPQNLKALVMAMAAAGLLAACGGGGGGDGPAPAPEPKVQRVQVVGDSLSDSGTFGFKYTVQGNDSNGQPFQLWSERIAASYKPASGALCAHYQSTSEKMTAYTENKSCLNYAVAGAEINPLQDSGAPYENPLSIIRQLKDLSSAGVNKTDLLLVAGGSNDAASLVENFLGAIQGNQVPLMHLLASKIDAVTLDALVAQGQEGLVKAGGLYMQNLAKALAAAINTELLAKGAQQVAILNVPAITKTPEFVQVLKYIETQQGSAQAAMLESVFNGWVEAFNSALAEVAKNESRIAVADFYTDFKAQVGNPATYGYRNTTAPACDALSFNVDLVKCTAQALSAQIPKGETTADWWTRYMFSNAFHPTPYGHEQMASTMSRTLQTKGWQP